MVVPGHDLENVFVSWTQDDHVDELTDVLFVDSFVERLVDLVSDLPEVRQSPRTHKELASPRLSLGSSVVLGSGKWPLAAAVL